MTKKRGSSKPKTAKERVLARYPKAEWYRGAAFYSIHNGIDAGTDPWIGEGATPDAAWADAAARLREQP